jgi:hypothetical protein
MQLASDAVILSTLYVDVTEQRTKGNDCLADCAMVKYFSV